MKTKTYKRELAVAMLGLFYIAVFTQDVEMIETLIWPTFSFAALAFGLDWKGKFDAYMVNLRNTTD
jgi:hypothetical protein